MAWNCEMFRTNQLFLLTPARIRRTQLCLDTLEQTGSARSSWTRARLDQIFTPSASIQLAVVRFYLHGNSPAARAAVKDYCLWRESDPWMPVFCCCFLWVCFWFLYMFWPLSDPCYPTVSRTGLLDSSISWSSPLPGLTHHEALAFSPVSQFAKQIHHLSILPISVYFPFKSLWGLFERNNNSCLFAAFLFLISMHMYYEHVVLVPPVSKTG